MPILIQVIITNIFPFGIASNVGTDGVISSVLSSIVVCLNCNGIAEDGIGGINVRSKGNLGSGRRKENQSLYSQRKEEVKELKFWSKILRDPFVLISLIMIPLAMFVSAWFLVISFSLLVIQRFWYRHFP